MSAEWAFSRAVATALAEESCSRRQGWVGCVALWQLGVRSRGGYSVYGNSSEGLRAHGWAPSRSASGPGWDVLPALLLGLFALFARLSLLRFPLARCVLQGLRSWDRNRDGVRRAARPPGRLGYSAGASGPVGLVAPGLRGRGQCDTQRFVRRVTFSWVGSQSARRRGLGWDVLPALCVRRGFSIHVCFVSSPPARYLPLHLQGALQKETQSRKEKPLRRDRGTGGLWSRKKWRPKGCAGAGGFSVAGRQPARLGYSAGDSGLVGLVAPGLRGRGQCDGQRFVRRVAFSWVGSQSARRRGLGWDVLPALCACRGFSIHVCFCVIPACQVHSTTSPRRTSKRSTK